MAIPRKTPVIPRITLEQHRQHAQAVFGKLPCKIQAKVSIAQMEGKHVVFVSGTGTGKTYTFWLPLIHDKDSIIVVISPLNVLASKQAEELSALEAAGIKAIALDAESCSEQNIADVTKGVYRVIIMPPELVNDARLSRVWNNTRFTSRLARLVFDEAHCLSEWGRSFRAAYVDAAKIRWRLPDHVRLYLASATMPEEVLNDCMRIAGLSHADATIVQCSNDRPNISLTVRPMKYSQTSLADLAFIIPREGDGFTKPRKFMVFCNARKETERVGQYLRKRIGPELQDKVVWFHSGMSKEFRAEKFEQFKRGELWGLACTDAAGMGLDVPDIELVVQWKATPSLCTLMQRFGRAARDPMLEGEGILIVEKSYIRDGKTKKRKRPSATHDKDDDTGAASSGSEASDAENEAVSGSNVEATLRPSVSTPSAPRAASSAHGRPKKRRKIEVQPPMDRFINPCACRRGVSNNYFGNDKVAAQEPCCPRCAPRAVRVCCDICCPSKFTVPALDPRDIPERQKRRKKARFEQYTRSDDEKVLERKLRELRIEYGQTVFGARGWAAEAFLQHALKTVDDLRYHTTWVFSDEYGQVLVDAVLHAVPLPPEPIPPPPPTAPPATPLGILGNITNTSAQAVAKKTRKKMKCGKCSMLGHNRTSASFLYFSLTVFQSQTETAPAHQRQHLRSWPTGPLLQRRP
ncbi:P-loop containing nucleoside triphosphate hydrolase protein [Exidia glandulosa HHB12029]|uniref:DNA 3'-5' helicase n=1 Tax=Exidia glandulosa HHB12029 TaxID=1314781 RepID=A0A165CLQ6_EXIGL|nr:P-loop containing nucleoside triphosphate hydrolase protein [Exidia glandulosa HHB12029]